MGQKWNFEFLKKISEKSAILKSAFFGAFFQKHPVIWHWNSLFQIFFSWYPEPTCQELSKSYFNFFLPQKFPGHPGLQKCQLCEKVKNHVFAVPEPKNCWMKKFLPPMSFYWWDSTNFFLGGVGKQNKILWAPLEHAESVSNSHHCVGDR